MHMSGDRTPVNAKMMDESYQGKKLVINDLTVFLDEIIGRGSNETVVYKGTFLLFNAVAVKRIKKAYFDVYEEEIRIHYLASSFRDIVNLYTHLEDGDFIYVITQFCDYNLYEFVKNETYAELFRQNEYPSPELLKLMWDIVAVLACLHTHDIIHRDLKPQNMLILKYRDGGLCPKLSGMRSSSRLATGWRAPEQILHGPQTMAMDMFNLGCVLFFCLTRGEHPYGDLEREINVTNDERVNLSLVEHNYEAMDLFSRLLDPIPEMRPMALEVLIHPLFWKSSTRMQFLWDASWRMESKDEKTGSIVAALESKGHEAFLETWDKTLEPEFLSHMTKRKSEFISHMTKRKSRREMYRYNKVQDLLCMIQDTINDYYSLPMKIQGLLGPTRVSLDNYFRQKFPKLLTAVYDVMHQHCYEEEWFRFRLGDIHGAGNIFIEFQGLQARPERKQQVSTSNNSGESELETEVESPKPQQNSSSTVDDNLCSRIQEWTM